MRKMLTYNESSSLGYNKNHYRNGVNKYDKENLESKILKEVKKIERGTPFFISDFLYLGRYNSIYKALTKLAKKKKINHVARGIYARYKINPRFGEIPITSEQLAQAISNRDGIRIMPTEDYALNALHLSTQVPVNPVYLTDGNPRLIKTGKRVIRFERTSPRNLDMVGPISRLVVLAIKEIGKDNITSKEIKILSNHLKKENPIKLEHDMKLIPKWIQKIMHDMMEKMHYE